MAAQMTMWYAAFVQLNTRYGTLVVDLAKDVEPIIKFNHHIYVMGITINGEQISGRSGRVNEKGELSFSD